MKFMLTWKDPDGDRHGQIQKAAEKYAKENGISEDQAEEELGKIVGNLLSDGIGEYICVEIDTETRTARLT